MSGPARVRGAAWARRVAILAGWSGAAFLLYGVLMFVFTFGDCRSDDYPCRQHQLAAGEAVTVVMSILYGTGLGVMLERWLLRRAA